MPGRRIALAAVLGGAALCPLRADAVDAHALIVHCAETAAAHTRDLTAVRTACPGIDQAAARLHVDGLLPADWVKKATPTTLVDLDALTERYSSHPSSVLPAASDLRAIALRLQQPDSARSSHPLWERIKKWLRRRLAPPAGFLKWLRSLPGWTAGPGSQGVLLIATTALILLGAAAFFIAELRAADVAGTDRRRRANSRRGAAEARGKTTGGDVDGADAAHALDRPALALRMLIEALRRSRRIERDGNLTCREVVARALFDTQGQREGFARIALLAERELYGPRDTTIRLPDELRPALESLYTQLSAAPAVPPAAS